MDIPCNSETLGNWQLAMFIMLTSTLTPSVGVNPQCTAEVYIYIDFVGPVEVAKQVPHMFLPFSARCHQRPKKEN